MNQNYIFYACFVIGTIMILHAVIASQKTKRYKILMCLLGDVFLIAGLIIRYNQGHEVGFSACMVLFINVMALVRINKQDKN